MYTFFRFIFQVNLGNLLWTVRVNEEFKVVNKLEEECDLIPVTPFLKNLDDPYVMANGES